MKDAVLEKIKNIMPANKQIIVGKLANDEKLNTEEKDMIFYEYEIVDRRAEEKWARKQARRYGLCIFSRWVFMLFGNLVLIILICGTSAIILYVNTPTDLTYQPLSYGRSCSTGFLNC